MLYKPRNRPVSNSQLPLITMTIDSFYRDSLNLVLNLRKYQRDLNLQQYTELWIFHILIGAYEY